jgi:TM2 domain-containing membrane protein YozV
VCAIASHPPIGPIAANRPRGCRSISSRRRTARCRSTPFRRNAARTGRPHPARPANDRNKLVAALLAFFIGIFGVHRFYLGRTGSGIAMLVLTCTFVGILISGPWAFIDMIRYLIMSDEEFEVRYRRR